MVLIIILVVIAAFIAAYFVIKKMPRQSGAPATNNPNLQPVSPPTPDAETRPRRPKY